MTYQCKNKFNDKNVHKENCDGNFQNNWNRFNYDIPVEFALIGFSSSCNYCHPVQVTTVKST